jgi:hypothetical protein
MNEQEWVECADPQTVLEFLRGKASERKLRLFACACCRRFQTGVAAGGHTGAAVEAAERFADGACSESELRVARAGAIQEVIQLREWVPFESADKDLLAISEAAVEATRVGWVRKKRAAWHAACGAAAMTQQAAWEAPWDAPESKPDWGLPWALHQEIARAGERLVQVGLVRCIFGNPFRPVSIPPAVLAWNDGTIPRLAQAIYDERSFDPLPILADALEEAGCTNQDILAHCRQSRVHCRGCWVVDSILGKS